VNTDAERVRGPGWEERRESRRVHRERLELQAAEWKALELARELFGRRASIRRAPFPSRGDFRGLVTLSVPFRDLDDHRRREATFVGMAGQDDLLACVPLVFVFEPLPVSDPRTALTSFPLPGPGGIPSGARSPRVRWDRIPPHR
jgi:hypothetical protein